MIINDEALSKLAEIYHLWRSGMLEGTAIEEDVAYIAAALSWDEGLRDAIREREPNDNK